MSVDKNWWSQDWPHPYAPSDDDAKFFEDNKVEGTTLLLGCTKKLIRLSDWQMDIDPYYHGPNMITQDWLTNTNYYDNIIGDGVINFSKDFEIKLLDMCSKHCKNFITRSFNYKYERFKIASNFPTEEYLYIKPTIVKKFDDYSFYVWRF